MKFFVCTLWVLYFFSSHFVTAATFDFNGFATLTAGYNSSDEIGFSPNFRNKHRTGASILRDTNIGGQLNIDVNANWDAVAQVILQDRYVKNPGNFVELAFLRYRPSRNWAIRAGRMNSDIYLLSEYPYIGSAYLWTRPPQEFYSLSTAVSNFDGLDVEFSNNINDGFLRLKVAVGKTSPEFVNDGFESEITFDNLLNFSVSYQKGSYTLRASHSKADVGNYKGEGLNELIGALGAISPTIWPNAELLADDLDFKGKKSTFSALGVTYDTHQWLVQSEVSLTLSDWLISPATLSGYFSLGYKLDDVTVFASLAGSKAVDDQPDYGQVSSAFPEEIQLAVSQLQFAVMTVAKGAISHQSSISVGAKWYASNSVALKAQFDHFTIQPNGGVLWTFDESSQMATKQHVNILSVSASMVF